MLHYILRTSFVLSCLIFSPLDAQPLSAAAAAALAAAEAAGSAGTAAAAAAGEDTSSNHSFSGLQAQNQELSVSHDYIPSGGGGAASAAAAANIESDATLTRNLENKMAELQAALSSLGHDIQNAQQASERVDTAVTNSMHEQEPDEQARTDEQLIQEIADFKASVQSATNLLIQITSYSHAYSIAFANFMTTQDEIPSIYTNFSLAVGDQIQNAEMILQTYRGKLASMHYTGELDYNTSHPQPELDRQASRKRTKMDLGDD